MRPKFWVVAVLFAIIIGVAFFIQNSKTTEKYQSVEGEWIATRDGATIQVNPQYDNARKVKLKGGKVFHVGINGTPMILTEAEYQYVSKLELRAGKGCDGFGMLD